MMIDLKDKHVVVTFLMHLGDVILTTPFVRALKNAAPTCKITYVIDAKLKEVMQYNPCIDTIVAVDKKGKDNSIASLGAIAKEITKTRPDVVINLHPNERTSYLAWKIDAPVHTGMSHFLFRPFMTKYTRLDRLTKHAADMYVNVLEQLGVENLKHEGLEVFTCPLWEEKAKQFYLDSGWDEEKPLVGFNIGSAVPEKRWPVAYFAEVADHFSKNGYETVFFGGTMDREMVENAVALMESKPFIATGHFSLGELAAAMKYCSLLITNDSGPMHVGVSQKIPIVALYGPSNPKFYGPYTDKAIVLESTTEYVKGKSMKKIIREGKYKGLTVIQPRDVIEAAEKLLKIE